VLRRSGLKARRDKDQRCQIQSSRGRYTQGDSQASPTTWVPSCFLSDGVTPTPEQPTRTTNNRAPRPPRPPPLISPERTREKHLLRGANPHLSHPRSKLRGPLRQGLALHELGYRAGQRGQEHRITTAYQERCLEHSAKAGGAYRAGVGSQIKRSVLRYSP